MITRRVLLMMWLVLVSTIRRNVVSCFVGALARVLINGFEMYCVVDASLRALRVVFMSF